VNRNTAGHYRNPTEYRRDRYARYDQLQRETVLPIGAALIIIVLLSLGLWWAIWSVVLPLASALLGWRADERLFRCGSPCPRPFKGRCRPCCRQYPSRGAGCGFTTRCEFGPAQLCMSIYRGCCVHGFKGVITIGRDVRRAGWPKIMGESDRVVSVECRPFKFDANCRDATLSK
jgi:hypothetical protein